MRLLLGLSVVLAASLEITACGGLSERAITRHLTQATQSIRASTVASSFSRHSDRDNDGDRNDDDEGVLNYGHAASAADELASLALVKRYFAAAAAEDGVTACSLLVPFIAESVVEDYGGPATHGETCATVMARFFRLRHRLLSANNRALKILEIRVQNNKALAILEFPEVPVVRQIVERREGGSWRLLDLFDGKLE